MTNYQKYSFAVTVIDRTPKVDKFAKSMIHDAIRRLKRQKGLSVKRGSLVFAWEGGKLTGSFLAY